MEWEDYTPIGEPIPGTRFICFKVPLKKTLCSSLPEEQHFTPDTLLERLTANGWKLGLIIDLTNTTRYYDPEFFRKSGIKYKKIFTEGKVVPSSQVKMKFFSVVDNFVEKNSEKDLLIGVHCTHGVNRTGHLVCRYMIDRLSFEPDTAINAYNEARGHKVERENYLLDLKNCQTNMASYETYKANGCQSPPPSASSMQAKRGKLMSRGGYNRHTGGSRGYGDYRNYDEERQFGRQDYWNEERYGDFSSGSDFHDSKWREDETFYSKGQSSYRTEHQGLYRGRYQHRQRHTYHDYRGSRHNGPSNEYQSNWETSQYSRHNNRQNYYRYQETGRANNSNQRGDQYTPSDQHSGSFESFDKWSHYSSHKSEEGHSRYSPYNRTNSSYSNERCKTQQNDESRTDYRNKTSNNAS